MTDTLRRIEKIVGKTHGGDYQSQVSEFMVPFQSLLNNSAGKWALFHQSERFDERLSRESLVWGRLYAPKLGSFLDGSELCYKLSFGTPDWVELDETKGDDGILGPCSLQRGINLLTKDKDLILYRYDLTSPLIDNLTPTPEFISDSECDAHISLIEPISYEEWDIYRHLYLGISRLDSNELFEEMKKRLLKSIV